MVPSSLQNKIQNLCMASSFQYLSHSGLLIFLVQRPCSLSRHEQSCLSIFDVMFPVISAHVPLSRGFGEWTLQVQLKCSFLVKTDLIHSGIVTFLPHKISRILIIPCYTFSKSQIFIMAVGTLCCSL